MNIKILYLLIFSFILSLFAGCSKKSNEALAANYYKLSRLEIEDQIGGGDNLQEFEIAAKKSLGYLDDAIRYDKKGEYFALRGTLLFQLKKYQDAKEAYNLALACELEPKIKCEVLNNNAALLAQLGDEEGAKEIWQKLIDNKSYLTPEIAAFNYGRLLCQNQEYDAAKKRFLESTTLAPNYVDAHFYLAVVSGYYLNDIKTARVALDAVLYLEPSHEPALKLQKFLESKV